MAFFLCSEPWGQIQGSCQVDWVKKLMEPCLLDIPSRAQMFQRMCASTSEWIPHLHIIQCIKCWSWGWAHVLVILVTRGDVSAESEYSTWMKPLQHGLVQWLSPGLFAHVERTIKLIQGLCNRTWSTILHEKGLQQSQGKTHKSQVNDSLQARDRWSIQGGPNKVTAQCPRSSSVLREASSYLIRGSFLHIAPVCGITPLLEAKQLVVSQEQSLSPL